jgi:hypothetical protein
MSQIRKVSGRLAAGCALLALLAFGCSKHNGNGSFDPDAGHPANFVADHPAAYRNANGECTQCHGTDLLGGISTVSCFSASRNGLGCHPDGPGGHPPGWQALHSADPSKAATCAVCHKNKDNNLPPDCFNNSLCHGPKSGHPSGWRFVHSQTNPSLASNCAACHQSKPGTPGCFNNTLCHGAKSSHPAGWLQTHSRTDPSQAAAVCAGCHTPKSTPVGCFNNSLCHGAKSNHPTGWLTTHSGTDPGQASVCAGCHQSNPGTPGCFNNTLCHGAKGNHPVGWSSGSQHGAAAKAAGGFPSCTACHGSSLGGGIGPTCQNASCHGWGAPHASSGWSGGGSRHRSTNVSNVSVCAQCHPVSAPSSGSTCSHNGGACHGG